ncbi:MAG: YkgJ family cysteine cluster protein [Actinomycetota bacterium]|nr:YkgJ family cysteine cluster protein [Actinomycetota bacterium]
MTGSGELAAGEFGSWLGALQEALRGEGDTDVPCGSCVACCSSAQFIHIGPDERDALAHIPAELVFPAPRLPRGHVLMGYDEHGRCPLLIDGECSIYAHRPRTCRVYDCRVFAAAGIEPDDDKPLIAAQAVRWRFDYPGERDEVLHAAMRATAAFVQRHRAELPEGSVPLAATARAVQAVALHELFTHGEPTVQAVAVELRQG